MAASGEAGALLLVSSSRSDSSLAFESRDGEYVTVRLSSAPFTARLKVCMYTDPRGVATLLRSAAVEWRGWKKPKAWESIEGQLRITLRHDGLGHVGMEVVLTDDCGQPEPWSLQATLAIEAGSLEEIASRAELFFDE
jgi:Family of unknown function (DUF6228)